jgi:Raf kinase inhibitor-like YbhB/YbcL family protein
MVLLGRLLHRLRADEKRSPFAGPGYAAPLGTAITLNTPAFSDGGRIPPAHAGKGVGDNASPALHWRGVPVDTKQLVLIIDDVDVPLPKPLVHTIAVIEPEVDRLGEGDLRPGTAGVQVIPTILGRQGYAGPRPIPGHGPHRYRFLVFALDERVSDDVTTAKTLLDAIRGHVIARGMLTGTYER